MGGSSRWFLVITLLCVTTATWVPYDVETSELLRRALRNVQTQNVQEETTEGKIADEGISPSDEPQTTTESAMIEETTVTENFEIATTVLPVGSNEAHSIFNDDKETVTETINTTLDNDTDDVTTTQASEVTTIITEVTDAQPSTEKLLVTVKEETIIASQESRNLKRKAMVDVVSEVSKKDQMEDVDAIVKFEPRSTTSSPTVTTKPTKLTAKLLEFLKNNKPKARSKMTVVSTSTEPAPTTPQNKLIPHKVYGARIISRSPSAEDTEKISDSPRIARARFFASGSSLLSGFVSAVPPPNREGRARQSGVFRPVSATDKFMPVTTQNNTIEKEINNDESEVTDSVVATPSPVIIRRVLSRRKLKPPAPRPPTVPPSATTTTTPNSTPSKTPLRRLSQNRRIRVITTTEPSTTPITEEIVIETSTNSQHEHTTLLPLFRKFRIRDRKNNSIKV